MDGVHAWTTHSCVSSLSGFTTSLKSVPQHALCLYSLSTYTACCHFSPKPGRQLAQSVNMDAASFRVFNWRLPAQIGPINSYWRRVLLAPQPIRAYSQRPTSCCVIFNPTLQPVAICNQPQAAPHHLDLSITPFLVLNRRQIDDTTDRDGWQTSELAPLPRESTRESGFNTSEEARCREHEESRVTNKRIGALPRTRKKAYSTKISRRARCRLLMAESVASVGASRGVDGAAQA